MIKGSIQEEGLTLIDVYVPNIGAHNYIFKNTNRHIEITDGNAVIVGHPTFINDRSSRQKISMAAEFLTAIIE